MDKKIYKIYNTINKLALGGKNNELKYSDYVYELIDKGQFSFFKTALSRHFKLEYDIDTPTLIKKSWKEICFNTSPKLSIEIKRLYTKYNVYQVAHNIFRGNDNLLLGTLKEIQIMDGSYDYHIKNKKLSKLLGLINTFIEVQKTTDEEPTLVADQFEEIKDNRNLIKRYELGILYLLSE
jgi:hypothetical protein